MRHKFYISLLLPLLIIVLLFIISNYLFLFPSVKSNFVDSKKTMIKELTNVAYDIIEHYNNTYTDSLPENKIKKLALDQLSKTNYGAGKKSYFWITDLTPTMLMHPYRMDLDGKDLSDFHDIHGFHIFKESVEIVKKNGEGYIQYYWQWQDDSTKILPKLSYVKLYKDWNWVVGTGVYINDIEDELKTLRKDELKHISIITFFVLLLISVIIQFGIKQERNKLEALQKLKNSEEKFRNLFENSNDIIILSDLNGKILDINKKALTIYGLKKENIVGKTTYDMMPKKYHSTIKKRVKSAAIQNLPPIEVELSPTKNQNIDVEIKSSLLSFENKKVLLSTLRDITTRKIQNQKLLENRLHYKIVADYTNDWEYWIGNNGEIKYISPSCEKISGYKPNDFISNPKLYSDIIYNDDINIWNTYHSNVIEHQTSNDVIEFRIRHKKGHLVWIEHSCLPVYDNNNDFIGTRGSNRDISDRKSAENNLLNTYKKLEASEKKFKTLSDITFEGIALHINGLVLEMNLAFLNMFGYKREELLHVNSIKILFDKDSQKQIKNNIASHNTIPYEVVGIKKDGSRFPVEIEAKDYHSEDEGDSLRVAAFRDITERKMHEKKVLNAIIAGEEKERSRIAKELHDGLGPYLSTMKFYFQWLAESDNEEKKKIIIEKGNQSMHEAITILKEISNNLNPHILTNYGLMDAIASFITKYDENELIEFYFTPLADTKIAHSTEVALYRIVIELINNSLKHANASKIYITFKTTDTNQLKMIYADNGIGFKMDELKSKNNGSGMLNIKNRLATLNGTIEITTSPNKGFIAKVLLNKY